MLGVKIILVVDWNIKNDNFWLKNELEKNRFKVRYPGLVVYTLKDRTIKWRKLLLRAKYMFTALNVIFKSKEEDVTISWNFVLGVWIGFFGVYQ